MRIAATLALLTALAACATPRRGTPTAAPAAASARDSGDEAPPVVQVREFAGSAYVTVLGWAGDENRYGLGANVNREGALTGAFRNGDHRLFIAGNLVTGMGGFRLAAGPGGAQLPVVRAPVGDQPCWRDLPCAPLTAVNLSVPDTILQQVRDSLVVRFETGPGHTWSLALGRDVIGAYLRTVDSVRAAARRR